MSAGASYVSRFARLRRRNVTEIATSSWLVLEHRAHEAPSDQAEPHECQRAGASGPSEDGHARQTTKD
jgi:hypothetical protein